MRKVCIVGYGAVGRKHAVVVEQTKGLELYAVCDIDVQKQQECVAIYGCKAYGDYDEMLKDKSVDSVHICTPHYLHKIMAIKALQSGKAVILEKPVGISKEEYQELYAVSKEYQDTPLCIMLQNRTNSCVKELKKIISQRELGKLQGIVANLLWRRDEEYYAKENWRGKWKTEGGGLLINQAIHLLDLMVYFGGKVKSVKSDIHRWKLENIEVEDNASALLEFQNGAIGVFHGTNCYALNESFQLELRFEKGHFRYADGVLYEMKDDSIQILARDDKFKIGKSYWGNGHQNVILAFYDSMNGIETEYPQIEDAYEVMNLVFDIYENGRERL